MCSNLYCAASFLEQALHLDKVPGPRGPNHFQECVWVGSPSSSPALPALMRVLKDCLLITSAPTRPESLAQQGVWEAVAHVPKTLLALQALGR
jgi:hypothetical protein